MPRKTVLLEPISLHYLIHALTSFRPINSITLPPTRRFLCLHKAFNFGPEYVLYLLAKLALRHNRSVSSLLTLPSSTAMRGCCPSGC